MSGVRPTSPEGNAAYRKGRCVDCRVRRYSAGRPRCNEREEIFIEATEPEERLP
jgi:hypothetical protein